MYLFRFLHFSLIILKPKGFHGVCMNRIIMKLVPGVLLTVILAFAVLFTYSFNLYFKAKPGFTVSSDSQNLSEADKKEILVSLIRLSELAEALGLDYFNTLFSASAASMLGVDQDNISIIKAEYYHSRAITAANQVVARENDYHPLLQTYFGYGLFLNDLGKKEEAIRILEKAISIGSVNDPENYWIDNIQRALKFIRSQS